MPLNKKLKKVMVIGSGPINITKYKYFPIYYPLLHTIN